MILSGFGTSRRPCEIGESSHPMKRIGEIAKVFRPWHTGETEIEFQKDAEGEVAEMVIHNSDGSVIRGPRLDVASPR